MTPSAKKSTTRAVRTMRFTQLILMTSSASYCAEFEET